jgi:hypothetical protein
MDEQSFNVVSGSELQSITDSEKGWYLDRDNTATQSSNDRVETLYRHTDPDDCLNCLTAENTTQIVVKQQKLKHDSKILLIKILYAVQTEKIIGSV